MLYCAGRFRTEFTSIASLIRRIGYESCTQALYPVPAAMSRRPHKASGFLRCAGHRAHCARCAAPLGRALYFRHQRIGYDFLFRLSFAVLPFAMKKHKNLVSGMYYDLVSGKKCDVDFVAGAVERSAAKVGVKVPAISAAIALAHAIERGEENITPANILKLTQIIKNN